MQYFKPEGNFFVGDCMPFFHDGVFHFFYLLDENHHQGLGGLGGHQWAHATTTDLRHWQQQPLALPLSEPFEGSICSGSVFFQDEKYYAWYATRMRDATQHLSLATSIDGIHFEKTQPNPIASPPPGYSPLHFRDPFVFKDETTGMFHMLLSAQLENYPLTDRGGCLAHRISWDLKYWEQVEPLLIPGFTDVPECADYFFWNDWYYLLFSNSLTTRYRMSRAPMGPWLCPASDVLDSPPVRVMKTAPFTQNRRIGAAWLGTRFENKDDEYLQWGGQAVFREVFQHTDGALGTRFLPEMIPTIGEKQEIKIAKLNRGVNTKDRQISLFAPGTLAVAAIDGLPQNCYIKLIVRPRPHTQKYGLGLRGSGNFTSKYDLCFLPFERKITLHDQELVAVTGLKQYFQLEIILKNDIIDICFDNRRCLINRCPELNGDRLFLFCQNGDVIFESLEIRPLAVDS